MVSNIRPVRAEKNYTNVASGVSHELQRIEQGRWIALGQHGAAVQQLQPGATSDYFFALGVLNVFGIKTIKHHGHRHIVLRP